jgi:HSP20 family molecular chaperone IbpA
MVTFAERKGVWGMEKDKVTPCACFSHDDGRLKVDIEPGVDKRNISLEMRKNSFCVSAPREGSEYSGCFMFAHEVEPEKAEAKFESGLLRIYAPIKDWQHKVSVPIG